jgi:hypothetical protein
MGCPDPLSSRGLWCPHVFSPLPSRSRLAWYLAGSFSQSVAVSPCSRPVSRFSGSVVLAVVLVSVLVFLSRAPLVRF